jgi:hypothetical protein
MKEGKKEAPPLQPIGERKKMSDKTMHDAADAPHEHSASTPVKMTAVRRVRAPTDDVVANVIAGIAVAIYPETAGPVLRAPAGAVPDTIIMPRELARAVAGMYGNDVRMW